MRSAVVSPAIMSSKNDDLNIRRGTLHDDLWIKPIASYYSPSQIVQWLSRINHETAFTEQEVSSRLFPADLSNLNTLMRLHLLAFPFENTSMHYTPEHFMDVSPQGVFQRLVQDHKGGSYCFGQNTLFLGMLRGLGYRAYPGMARVNQSPPESGAVKYSHLVHMFIFVQPIADSNETYVVDVGFAATALSQPILLSNAETNVVWGAIPPERHRLTRGSHPLSSLETRKYSDIGPNEYWQLEVTRDVEDPTWSISYAFSEDEFYISECSVASFGASMAPRGSIFWGEVLIVKRFLLSEEQGNTAEIAHSLARLGGTVGSDSKIDRQKGPWLGRYIMVGGKVKRQVGTQSETIIELKDEIQRIRAAREIFGIDIDDSAAKYIEGRAAALSQTTQQGTTPLHLL